MLVKKFEARNMKEALVMIKKNLGPDAVILQAKDNSKKYGLAGHSSVEVTAAVSESTFQKKRIVESKMTEAGKEKFNNISASRQREYINKAFDRKDIVSSEFTKTRYVDIIDDDVEPTNVTKNIVNVTEALSTSDNTPSSAMMSTQRVREAAQSAWNAGLAVVEDYSPRKRQPESQNREATTVLEPSNHEVMALRREIHSLKQIISSFKQMPQTIISSHPGANEGIHFELSAMFEKLTRAGLSVENCVEMLKEAQESLPKDNLKKQPYVDAWVARRILDTTRIVSNPFDKTKYHVFIGGSGEGKTSTLVKFASQLVIKKRKKIVILSTDTSRVGAAEQLKIFAQILNVPFSIIRSSSDWAKIDSQLKNIDHILVDFPGLQMKSEEQVTFFSHMLPPAESGRKLHYVQSVLAKDCDAFEQYKRYRGFGVSDVIFTGLDESNQHGLIYNFQKKFNLPLHSFGIGSSIPEDYELATRERVVDLIFKLTKIRKF